MKILIAAAVLAAAAVLCILAAINKKRHGRGFIMLLLFGLLMCSCFNLVIFKVEISDFKLGGGLFTIALFTSIYMLFIMLSRKRPGGKQEKSINFMITGLTLINIYLFSEPLFMKLYSTGSYSMYLFTYLNLELMLVLFLLLSALEYDVKSITGVICLFSLLNGFVAVMQGITGRLLVDFSSAGQQLTRLSIGTRVSGFITGDNGGGNLGVILFPVLLYNYKKNKGLFNLFLVAADSAFIFFTFTRIAYLALAVELLIFSLSFFKPMSAKDMFKITFKVAAAGCAGIYLYANYFSEAVYLFFIQRGDTQMERFMQFPKAVNAFLSSPILGTGHGQYNQYALYKLGIFDNLVIHSQLLNILVEEGIIVFTIFCAFNIYLLVALMKKFRNKAEQIYIIMLFAGNLICINFNPNQTYEINIYLYYFILFGFLYAGKGDSFDKNSSKKDLLQSTG